MAISAIGLMLPIYPRRPGRPNDLQGSGIERGRQGQGLLGGYRQDHVVGGSRADTTGSLLGHRGDFQVRGHEARSPVIDGDHIDPVTGHESSTSGMLDLDRNAHRPQPRPHSWLDQVAAIEQASAGDGAVDHPTLVIGEGILGDQVVDPFESGVDGNEAEIGRIEDGARRERFIGYRDQRRCIPVTKHEEVKDEREDDDNSYEHMSGR